MQSSDMCHVQPTAAVRSEREVEREVIMDILNKINNYKISNNQQLEKSAELAESTELELHQAKSVSKAFFQRLENGFVSIREMFETPWQRFVHYATVNSPTLMKRTLRHLRTKDELDHEEHWPTNIELLTKISEELAVIEKYTTCMNRELIARLKCMEMHAKEEHATTEYLDSYYEKEFSEVIDLLLINCTTLKEEELKQD